ncbi:EAL domain-containing protein [Caballeronia sp. LP006]|uniref:EAL domain-containing protein n=1 Tax=Caballeronia sp. LP006 TaxID=3038552 RepID=UPI002860A5D0|nr:EAL domain-containing protein [Caballeronia sp. LP006]MDR5826360.1 EAL domain-containing protein [Caballeronia sp. LP006]
MNARRSDYARGRGFARRAYVLRTVGLTLGLVFVQMILWREHSSYAVKAYIAVYCVVWPHIAYLLARRSRTPANAERINMYVDDFVSGTSVAAMSFTWLPSTLVLLMFMMNNVAAGGWRQLAKGFLSCALGTLIGAAAFGGRMEPEWIPDAPTLLACLPMLVVYPLALGLASYRTALKLAERSKALRSLSEHDPLTGLLNRGTLSSQLGLLLDSQRGKRQLLNVLFIDLDDFKIVNDSLGHRVGDQLLTIVASRLRDATDDATEDIARYGGDEFVIVSIRSPVEAVRGLAGKVIEVINQPVTLAGQVIQVRASIGISTFPDHGNDPQALLSRADVAMYAAKAGGRNRIVQFNEQLHLAAARRLNLTARLQAARSINAFELLYQPQVDMGSGHIIGAEALIRWNDPLLGSISPTTFIPIAESDGQIHAIGEWVLAEALEQGRRWLDAGLPPMRIGVNVSPVQLEEPRFLERVQRSLTLHRFPPQWLELELTEGALIRDIDTVEQTLERLNEVGVSIAIDDFGTGYSSLASLQRFDIDRIKIDQKFVQAIGVAPRGEAIIKAVITLADALGFQIVAEGVETVEQRDFLTESGCVIGQGFLFDKPLTADAMDARLRQRLLPHDTSNKDNGCITICDTP